tara:strand:- start:233 stop:880 length:648 start_codon:yes stop_codon:yes gene_type:complete
MEELADILGPEAAMEFNLHLESMDTIGASLEYGERLFRQLIEEGDTEAAVRVDKSFLDTRLNGGGSVKIGRPLTEYPIQWPIVDSDTEWGRGSRETRNALERSHMMEIYDRAAYHPELYGKPTEAEMFLMLFCLLEHGPLSQNHTEVAILLAQRIGLPAAEWLKDRGHDKLHPEVEMFLEDLMKESKVKGRDKPSGEEQWSKRLSPTIIALEGLV